jgi:hypothetical protein
MLVDDDLNISGQAKKIEDLQWRCLEELRPWFYKIMERYENLLAPVYAEVEVPCHGYRRDYSEQQRLRREEREDDKSTRGCG